MSLKKIYFSIGALIIIAVLVIVLFFDTELKPTNTSGLPPGHPNTGEMPSANSAPSQPSKSNVRKDFIHTLEMMKKKVDEAPSTDTNNVLELARMMLDSHQATECIPYFERYIKAAPKNTAAMLDLSVAYYQLKQYDKAMETTKRILTLSPKHTTGMYNLGAIYATMEKKDLAKKTWENLVSKFPDSDDAKRAKEALKQL